MIVIVEALKFRVDRYTGDGKVCPSVDDMRKIIVLDDAIKMFEKKIAQDVK